MRDERSGLAAIVVLSAVALFGLLGAVPNVLALVASAALLAGASVRLALALVADRLDPGASSGRLLVQLTKNPTFAQLTGAIVPGAFTLIAAAVAVGQQGPTPTTNPQASPTAVAAGNTPPAAATAAVSLGQSEEPSPPKPTQTPTPAPTAEATAVTGRVTLLGKVPTGLPGLLVGSGAVITSDLDLRLRPCPSTRVGVVTRPTAGCARSHWQRGHRAPAAPGSRRPPRPAVHHGGGANQA